ncbi:MAG: FAD-dependent oxidoreductase, partial [Myxococcota bacterium]|nr:FAD-dependent oxidoreductase [Myxococcota bacterium]
MGLTAGLVVFVVGCAPQSTGLNGVRVGLEPGATEGPAGRGIDGESRAASLGLGFEASPVRHVVVIGGGVAGLAAAASAAEAGARVTLLEAMDELGGRALSAGAGMTFAGTSLQAEKGVEDSPDRAVEEWEEVTGAPADGWAVSFLEDSADVYDWLSNHGLPFCAVSASPLVTTPR